MAAPSDDEDLELRHYVDVLRRRKLSVIVTLVVVLAAGVAFTLVKPTRYRSSAEVLVQAPLSDRVLAPTGERAEPTGDSDAATQVAVLESASVRDAAEEAVGGKVDVDVRRKSDTDVIVVSATADTEAEAVKVAQVYTDTYLAKRREQLAAEITATIDAVKAEIGALDGVLAEVDRRIQDLNTAIQATFFREVRAPLEAERDQLTQQRAGPEARRSDLQQRLDRLQLASTLTKTGGVELLSAASEPVNPARSALLRNLAVSLALGLILGAAVAFLRDHFDDTVRSESDLERAGGGPQALGTVPAVRDWKNRERTELVMKSAPESPAAEAYSRLRTSLEVAGSATRGAILQITSAGPGDGKSTTVANLGVSFARAGRRVVLIDANLRRPRLHRFLSMENDVGLTSVLLAKAPISTAVQTAPDVPHLRVLTAGPRLASPSELLSGERAQQLIASLAAQADILLLDSPPLPVSDAIVLTGRADGVILVVCANRTGRRDLAEALEALDHARAPLVGTVLNCAPGKAGHGLTYGREPASEKGRRSDEKAAPEPAGTTASPKPANGPGVESPMPVEPVDS
jgi:non-specific protein-tyrosine kinase